MADKPLISVVTPFHNTAAYLEQCITSVLRQTYSNFEYLLCDNCSTDRSTEIAQLYASRDPRIRFIRFEELLPQVANYNRAVERIAPQAEWCKIVQADDWIFEQCLERMVRAGSLDNGIGLIGSYYLQGRIPGGFGLPVETEVFDGPDICRRQLRDELFILGSPTTVMYRARIVRSRRPFYSLNRYHEDTEAGYEILEHCKLGFVHELLSFMRVDNPSIMASLAPFNTVILDRLIVIERYAHRFFPPAEARALRQLTRRDYFMFLGRSLLWLRGREFWEYHRNGLATIGWTWSWTRILVSAILALFEKLLNPLHTVSRIWHHVRRRVGHAK